MTPTPRTVRGQEVLAAVFALIAGYTDAYALMNYRVYASFMSGNTTQTGLHAGRGQLADAAHNLLPIPMFVIGIVIGVLLRHSGVRNPFGWLCGIVALLLACALAAGLQDAASAWLSIVTLSLGMGAMNTTLSRIGGQSVSLGYMTGDLYHMAEHAALAVKRAPVEGQQGTWDTHGRRAIRLAAVWAAFLVGAALAGAATGRMGAWTLLPPTAVLVALATGAAVWGRR